MKHCSAKLAQTEIFKRFHLFCHISHYSRKEQFFSSTGEKPNMSRLTSITCLPSASTARAHFKEDVTGRAFRLAPCFTSEICHGSPVWLQSQHPPADSDGEAQSISDFNPGDISLWINSGEWEIIISSGFCLPDLTSVKWRSEALSIGVNPLL